MAGVITVDDTTFRRRVLLSPLPVVVLVRATGCESSRAMLPRLRELAAEYEGRIAVADLKSHAALAEQYGISITPTLMVMRYGDELLRAHGFVLEGLLSVLFEDALNIAGDRARLWTPTEEVFEDRVLVPLLEGWELRYSRQHPCPLREGASRGRIDLLVSDVYGPLTLFENKRLFRSDADLRQATMQAKAYAVALGLPSFVVAAPAGFWVHSLNNTHARLEAHFSSLELHTYPSHVKELLLQLREKSHTIASTINQ